MTERAYGGADLRNLGTAMIGTPTDVARPGFVFGSLTNDKVRQLNGGIGYELRWRMVAALSLGIQKTD
jgi:iron complex outermembrane receptor protein